jgi:SagB-type dehydrogenase family enzyme
MQQRSASQTDRLQVVLDYHEASKHRFEAFAAGPGFLDWDSQPDPFRRYAGARLIRLETVVPTDAPCYDAIFSPASLPAAVPVNRHTLSQLFYDSLALSAWKRLGDTRWALRVNASSGNLHPTEGYLVCGPVEGLNDRPMVCHYAAKEHGLEVRAEFDLGLWNSLGAGFPSGTFFLGLTSIHWREAWKYGRRAYRYCMHDAGHALGALAIAAAGLGWQVRLLDAPATDELALLLGTFESHEAEPEEPDMLLACMPAQPVVELPGPPAAALQAFESLAWQGSPNALSPSHAGWGIEAVAARLRKPHGVPGYRPFACPPGAEMTFPHRELALRRIIRQRRSAVAMDGQTHLPRDDFYRMLGRTLAMPGVAPFATLPWQSHVHLALLVHRVDDLPRGLYLLARDPAQAAALRAALTQADAWRKPPGCPESLPLYCLIEADTRGAARQIACQQDIASDGCFSVAMLAEFNGPLERYGPWFYPRLFWEAGMIGQLLYLEAEAAGIRATGIGCYFDDPMHEVLGIEGRTFQDLYHFTVGGPVEDARLTTLPAYE